MKRLDVKFFGIVLGLFVALQTVVPTKSFAMGGGRSFGGSTACATPPPSCGGGGFGGCNSGGSGGGGLFAGLGQGLGSLFQLPGQILGGVGQAAGGLISGIGQGIGGIFNGIGGIFGGGSGSNGNRGIGGIFGGGTGTNGGATGGCQAANYNCVCNAGRFPRDVSAVAVAVPVGTTVVATPPPQVGTVVGNVSAGGGNCTSGCAPAGVGTNSIAVVPGANVAI